MYFCATVPNTKQAKHICEQPQLCICVNNSLQRKKNWSKILKDKSRKVQEQDVQEVTEFLLLG